jgi:transcriptional regulator with XRE-family HTH domain
MTLHFGSQLKEWRQARRLSQLGLAGEAGISARHLSFLESGRSRPTEGMIMRLGEALELPARAQNELFAAAGYAPRFSNGGAGIDSLPSGPRAVLRLILDRHSPWPAGVFNADYDLVGGNETFLGMAAAVGISPGDNLLRAVATGALLRQAVPNWEEFSAHFLRRGRAEAGHYGPNSRLARLVAEISREPEIAVALAKANGERYPPPVLEIAFEIGGVKSRWITTVTTLGMVQEALTEGIFIEQFFPADEATRAMFAAPG